MSPQATRVQQIKTALRNDLERGLAEIETILERVAEYLPLKWHVTFDIHDSRITIEGEGTCDENKLVLQKIAAEFGQSPTVSWLADGWDGSIFTPAPHFVCIWVTNIGNPDMPKPKL